MKRTHNCSELREEDAGQSVQLSGWVDSVRDHGGILFVDLRDREGITQIVFDPQNTSLKDHFSQIKPESVISITGVVEKRIGNTINAQLSTGAIEVHASEMIVHNVSKTPPFPMDDTADKVGEELKMTYRYLDLRRQSNLDILRLRHKTNQSIRNYLDSVHFTEVELSLIHI